MPSTLARETDPGPATDGALPVTAPGPQKNAVLSCLSIDVEEYFHAEVFAGTVPVTEWPHRQRRVAPFLERIAQLLQRHEARATFFVLGDTVPHLRRQLIDLADAGHEIACHGSMHEHLARLDAARLRDDLRRARDQLADLLGVAPRGYRAPTFSLTRATSWAVDVIADAGFEYDTSIFPVRHDRYGVPDAPVVPFWLTGPSGKRLLEFPPLTLDWGLLRVPVAGGGYLRLLPGLIMRRALAYRVHRGEPAMLYVHPWELDRDQPTPPISRLARWRHRVNLHTTEPKLAKLLRCFRFDTAERVLARVRERGDVPNFNLG
ncbi:MAG: polysaccharide deacetylase family protein [Phycisphaerae bacterium]|jgi:polysaccharide deacetylase family protein (PEP-CTERM system associated)